MEWLFYINYHDFATADVYKVNDEIKEKAKTLVALVLISSEDVRLDFCKSLETFSADTLWGPLSGNMETLWEVETTNELPLWNQHEKALTGPQKTNNSAKGRHRA